MRMLAQQRKRAVEDETFRPLKEVRFTMIGLGDTNYSTFQGNPRRLKTLLLALGASTFHPVIEVDEVLGIENQIETWLVPMWRSLFSAIDFLIDEALLPPSVSSLSIAAEETVPAAPIEEKEKKEGKKKKKKIVFKPKPKTTSSSSSSSSEAPVEAKTVIANVPALRWSLQTTWKREAERD